MNKCKYCENGVALVDRDCLGLAIYYNPNGNNAYVRGCDKQGWDISETFRMNYCPICGKKLAEDNYSQTLVVNKWLIEMVVIATDKTYPIAICDTEEKAEEWIEEELKEKIYNGTGYLRKTKVPYYI